MTYDANDGFPIRTPDFGPTASGRLAGALAIVILFGLVVVLVLVPVTFLLILRHNDRPPAIKIRWVHATAPFPESANIYVPCAYRTDWYGAADLQCDFTAQILGPDKRHAGND